MSDSEEFSSGEEAAFLTQINLDENLIKANRLKELKWLKSCLDDEIAVRKRLEQDDFKVKRLHPPDDQIKDALSDPIFVRLLKYLNFDPPIGCDASWKIAVCFDEDDLQSDSETVQRYIFQQLSKCKSCNVLYKSIIKHLKKSEKCFKSYAPDEYSELLDMAKSKKKSKKAKWLKKNKDSVASQKADWYKKHKDQVASKYQENKTEISRKKLAYERENAWKISSRKAKYYLENKEKYQEKYKQKKSLRKTEEGTEEDSENEDNTKIMPKPQYSMKRKAIDFNMADLEAATEEEEEFKANVGPLEKKSLPPRICKT